MHKAIDLKLKHLNSSYKIKIKCYKNSTHDTDIIFNWVYLSNVIIKIVHDKMEHIFGKKMSGVYMRASMELNMFLLAYTIYLSDLAMLWGPGQLAGL